MALNSLGDDSDVRVEHYRCLYYEFLRRRDDDLTASNAALAAANDRQEEGREYLFDGASNGSGPRSMQGEDEETGWLMSESSSLNNSMKDTAGILNQGKALINSLKSQRTSMSVADGALRNTVRSGLEKATGIVRRIGGRKRMENRILAVVIATGVFFCFWYVAG